MIIEYRRKQRGFNSIAVQIEIKGIRLKTLKKLRPYVTLN